MRLVQAPRPERPLAENLAGRLAGPCFGQRTQERKQNRASREAHFTLLRACGPPARVHDQVLRSEHRLDFRQHERSFLASRDEPCRRKRERTLGSLDFGAERVDARTIRRGPGAGKRRPSRCRVAAAQRDLERDELAPRYQHGRSRAKVQIVERVARFGHPAEQEQPADLKERGVKSVVVIAQGAERAASFVERVRRPSEVARRERHLGFGRDASCALHALSRAERTRRAPQEHLGFRELAELSHGDPAQGERGRVVPKRDPLERAQGVACLECPRCRRDE